MTCAQTKAARRKCFAKYGRYAKHRSVGDVIEAERRKAAREASSRKKAK